MTVPDPTTEAIRHEKTADRLLNPDASQSDRLDPDFRIALAQAHATLAQSHRIAEQTAVLAGFQHRGRFLTMECT